MKKSELKKLIKEELLKEYNEEIYKKEVYSAYIDFHINEFGDFWGAYEGLRNKTKYLASKPERIKFEQIRGHIEKIEQILKSVKKGEFRTVYDIEKSKQAK